MQVQEGSWGCTCGEFVPAQQPTCHDCGSKPLYGISSGKSIMQGGRGLIRISLPQQSSKKTGSNSEYARKNKAFREKSNKNSSWKPGDWICHCGELNFSRRDKCHTCESSRDKQQNGRPGDWTCNCGEINFFSRNACRSCAEVKGTAGQVITKRTRDWICACSEFNFGNRDACRMCHESRPEVISST
ncbi:Zinc finger RanBP2-type [Perkinsela sp. CCAP 1560/4]|nr:Zinc finger RanBP2-type [Perkinsela sp. CCAP 1560/4]KNH08620.1 Zinc finger RanBP2-type [Perkinsela sp. CCAP 1560/4]|eukprot:KNH07578.1 Zinc finger RanBP2-type [Perkinsela sp. CCAP 1560/4]